MDKKIMVMFLKAMCGTVGSIIFGVLKGIAIYGGLYAAFELRGYDFYSYKLPVLLLLSLFLIAISTIKVGVEPKNEH